VCYDLAVQFQRDAVKQPVEDATVEWKESDTPFVRVAQVTIAQMNLNQEESKNKTDFCNQLNWNPWHSLKAHRPLGSINRLRMLSMRESQKYRGWSTLPKEPDGSEFQGSDTPK